MRTLTYLKANPMAETAFSNAPGFKDFCDVESRVKRIEDELIKAHAAIVGGDYPEWLLSMRQKSEPHYGCGYVDRNIRSLACSDSAFERFFECSLEALAFAYLYLESIKFDRQCKEFDALIYYAAIHIGRLEAHRFCLSARGKARETARKQKKTRDAGIGLVEREFAVKVFDAIKALCEKSEEKTFKSVAKLVDWLLDEQHFDSILATLAVEARERSPSVNVPSSENFLRWLQNQKHPLWKGRIRGQVIVK